MAEGVGFEPTKGYQPLLVFKTSAFNRSATPPGGIFGGDSGRLARYLRGAPEYLNYRVRSTPDHGHMTGAGDLIMVIDLKHGTETPKSVS